LVKEEMMNTTAAVMRDVSVNQVIMVTTAIQKIMAATVTTEEMMRTITKHPNRDNREMTAAGGTALKMRFPHGLAMMMHGIEETGITKARNDIAQRKKVLKTTSVRRAYPGRVSDRLSDSHDVDASEIDVKVEGTEVILSGQVSSKNEKRRAEDIAESVSGVSNVQNHLRVGQQQGMVQSKCRHGNIGQHNWQFGKIGYYNRHERK